VGVEGLLLFIRSGGESELPAWLVFSLERNTVSERQLLLGDFFDGRRGRAGGTVVVMSICSELIGLDIGLGIFIGGRGLGMESVVLFRLLTPRGGRGGGWRCSPLLE